MSVIVRRLLKPSPTTSLEPIAMRADLQKQKSILQLTIAQGELVAGSKICSDILLLALTLVNAAISYPQVPSSIASQAAEVTLSVTSAFRNFIPDLNCMTERDWKYANALSIDVETIRGQLSDAHGIVVKVLSSWYSVVDSDLSNWEKELRRSHEAFLRKVSSFMNDPDLSARRARRMAREDNDAHVLVWEDVKLGRRYQDQPGTAGIRGSFWDQTYQGIVRDEPVLVRKYSIGSLKDFHRDLETLKSHRHSHLPALFAHSADKSSTPFIAVSADSVIPFPRWVYNNNKKNPTESPIHVWEILMKLHDTAQYLLNHGICVENGHLDETLKGSVVRHSGQVILAPNFPRAPDTAFMRPISAEELPKNIARLYLLGVSTEVTEWSFGIDIANLPLFRPLTYAMKNNPPIALHSEFPQLRKKSLARPKLTVRLLHPELSQLEVGSTKRAKS